MRSNIVPWHPRIDTGFFYIEDKEYYLYSNKQVIRTVPTNGQITLPTITEFKITNGPIVITEEQFVIADTSGFYSLSAAKATPFAKTYEPPINDWIPTPHKYERVEDLTNLLEFYTTASGTIENYQFKLEEQQFAVNYGSPDSSGHFTPTITINQKQATPVLIEYEGQNASGCYIPEYIDINPIHSPNAVNKFLSIRDIRPSGFSIGLTNEEQYLHFPGDTITLNATVYDVFGGPVTGATLYWKITTEGRAFPISGSFANHFTTTDWAGTSRNEYTTKVWPPGLSSLFISAGQIVGCYLLSNGITHTSGTLRIETGFANA